MIRTIRKGLTSFLIVVFVLSLFISFIPSAPSVHADTAAPQLKVQGGQLVDKNSLLAVPLHGVTRYGTEYACIKGNGPWSVYDDNGHDPSQNEMTTMRNWGINAVRIPLNEDCWLNKNMPHGDTIGGTTYMNAIKDFVYLLLIPNGITPILDLHNTAPGTAPALGSEIMPDFDHSLNFWNSVTWMFGGDDRIIFDAFNEPAPPNRNNYDISTWNCWKDGQDGSSPDACSIANPNPGGCETKDHNPITAIWYHCIGMQELVNEIRAANVQAPYTGPDNVIILGGVNYAKEFNHWGDQAILPTDPDNNLAMSGHTYCSNYDCPGSSFPADTQKQYEWDQYSITPWLYQHPMIAGEIGEYNHRGTYIDNVMAYLENPLGDGSIPPQSYLVWHWNAEKDAADLIQDWGTNNYAPTCYGNWYQAWLLSHNPGACPP